MNSHAIMTNAAHSVPHTKSMLLIDDLVSFDFTDRKICVNLTIDSKKLYWDARHDRLKSFWLIELISQASAALYFNMCRAKGTPPEIGFLISIKNCSLGETDTVRPGDCLAIESTISLDFHPFGVFNSTVTHNNLIIAEAEMTMVSREGPLH